MCLLYLCVLDGGKPMRLNVYDTFEDEIATMNLAKKLQEDGMASMQEPHLWYSEEYNSINSNKLKIQTV